MREECCHGLDEMKSMNSQKQEQNICVCVCVKGTVLNVFQECMCVFLNHLLFLMLLLSLFRQ